MLSFHTFAVFSRTTPRLQVTVKTRIKEQVFWGFRLILLLYIGCFLQNQPENVLKVFLKLFL